MARVDFERGRHAPLSDIRMSFTLVYSPEVIFAHRRNVAERGGCFQRRLFVSLSVCLSTRLLPNY